MAKSENSMAKIDMSSIANHKVVLYLLLVSLLFNLLVGYVVVEKTDIVEKVLYKLGYGENPAMVFKRKVEFRCIQGWANTLNKLNLEADVVFFGNSLTYESDFGKYYPDLKIVNLGCNLDMLDDLINRSYMIKSVHPKKIFVLGGINNFQNTPLETFMEKYETMVDSIMIYNPDADVYLQSLLPVNPSMGVGEIYIDCVKKIMDANKIIEMISKTKNCTYIDLFSAYQVNETLPPNNTRDGLHLYPESYERWARIIEPYIR